MFKRSLALSLLSVLICSCADFPRDQHGATNRIQQSGILIVGVSRESGNNTSQKDREAHLVEKVAARLGVRIEWRAGNAHQLLQDLEELKLPLVAATVPCDSPFADRIGLSKPYLKDETRNEEYCLAVAPGENRLLLLVDEIIAEEESRNQ